MIQVITFSFWLYHFAHTFDNYLAGIVRRGCVRDLMPETIAMCREEGPFCKTCDSNNCNRKIEFQRCFSCNSAIDSNCVTIAADTLEPTMCRQYTDTCTTIITESGSTARGCTSEIIAVSQIVDRCVDSNCNAGIFPADRKMCHQCTGFECNRQLLPTDLTLQACNNYVTDEKCYSYINGE